MMCRTLIYSVSFVLVSSLVGAVQAADVTWTDTSGDHLWSTPTNWDTGTLPTSADTVKIRILPGPIVASPDAVANAVQPAAGGSTSELTVDGGILTIANRLVVAQSEGSNGTVNMISGTITVAGRYAVGRYGAGTLNMSGGTITVAGNLQMPEMASGTAQANLYGGTLTVDNLEMRVAGGVGMIDVEAGVLIINGDKLSTVQEYIDNGWITAYGGNGTLQLDFNLTNFGKTTLRAFISEPTIALNPFPAHAETDVSRDITLGWTPGIYADKHDVYFGTSFSDVNNASRANSLNVLAGPGQDESTYDPGRLDFGTSYYWRVDEVNAPPDNTIFKGDIWSFVIEPMAYPIDGANITATASSSTGPDFGPENTINGSGLDANDLHSTNAADMWLSGDEPQGAWIQYEFDKVYKLHEMWVWNANQIIEPLFGFGLKDVTVEYSIDGTDWTALTDVPQFAEAPGTDGYAHDTAVDFGGASTKYVKLTATSNWGGLLSQYGLSEVRFFYIPVSARKPRPDSGATDVGVDAALSWTTGREAARHEVYFDSDAQAVTDGTVPVASVTDASYSPVLDLGSTYYWRVDEVNEAETPARWQGDLWNFSTVEYLVVEDFEDYNDFPPYEIYSTWLDGYENAANGSQVGYLTPPSVEMTIVHGGRQSMPLLYSNTGGAAYSEATRTFAPGQDWSKHGIQTLVLYFYGTEGNTGQLYVKVNGVKVAYPGGAADIAQPQWMQWNIDLGSLGLNLQSVTTLSLGVDGIAANGTLYVDDIMLYKLAPEAAQ